jgi:hypothetical protein
LAAFNHADNLIRTDQLRLSDEQGNLADDLSAALRSPEWRRQTHAQQQVGEATGQYCRILRGTHDELSFRKLGPDNDPNIGFMVILSLRARLDVRLITRSVVPQNCASVTHHDFRSRWIAGPALN